MRLLLRYGVDRPDDETPHYGFDGPTLYGVESVEFNYVGVATIRFHDFASYHGAKRETDWAECGEMVLEVDTQGTFIVTREPNRNRARAYYGHFKLVDEFAYAESIKRNLAEAQASLERVRANIR
jgi:hypothetical protein